MNKNYFSQKSFSITNQAMQFNIDKKDQLLILINKLKYIINNFTKSISEKLSKKKKEISFIENNIDYAYKIINNILNHNYSYEQLKSLKETIIKLNENNKNNKIDILKEEQNLLFVINQSDRLLKIIINKQKQNLIKNEYKYKTDINNINSEFNNTLPPFKKRINLTHYNETVAHSLNSKNNSEQKRNKSVEIDKKINNKDNKNIKNNINSKNFFFNKINLVQLNSNINSLKTKSESKLIDCNDTIKNNNDYIIKGVPSSIINDDIINLYEKYEFLKKQNLIYERNIKKLKDELKKQNQKNPLNIFLQTKINQDINYKNKAIELLTKENEKLKKELHFLKKSLSHNNRNKKVLDNVNDNYKTFENYYNRNDIYSSFNKTEREKNNTDNNNQEIQFLKKENLKKEKYIKELKLLINKEKNLEKEYNLIKIKLNKNNVEYNEKIHKLNE